MKEQAGQHSGFETKIIKGISVGACIGFLSCLLLNALFSFAVLKCDAADSTLFVFSLIITAAAAFISGFTSSVILKKKGFLFGLLSAEVLFLILTVIALCINKGHLTSTAYIRAAIMGATGMFGGILGVNTRKFRK